MLTRLDPPSIHPEKDTKWVDSRPVPVETGRNQLLFYVSRSHSERTIASTEARQPGEWEQVRDAARTQPQMIAEGFWWFGDWLYKTTEPDLSAEDVRALALEQENRKRLKLEKAHALMAMREQLDSRASRQPIPQDVKLLVWQRDGGRCTECGSQSELEYDHIIPLAMGGSSTDRNLQLLCATCNRRKGATLG